MKAKIKKYFNRLKKILRKNEMLMLPGQLSFYLVLAIVPTVTLISYGASVLNLSMDFIYDFLSKAFSKDIADIMLSVSPKAMANVTIPLLVCYYISSNGTDSIIVVSNSIYGIKNGGWIKRRFKAIFLSILMILMILFLLIVPVFGNKILGLIKWVNLNATITTLIVKVFSYLKSPIMGAILFFLIDMIYVIAPDKKIKTRNTFFGALFTTIAWILTTKIYSLYVNNYANMETVYGALSTVSVLMIWFYFLAFFFVIGMSLNYQEESEELEKTNKS